MANNYTTSTDAFADMPEAEYATIFQPQMDAFVTTASRLIDLEVGRGEGFFYPTTDTAIRYYDGSGEYEQQIDEFVSISEVAVAETGGTASTDYTAWSSTDYMVYPYNYSADGKPITKLIIDGDDKPAFYRYRKSVRITGIAGYSTSVPALVAMAARTQAVIWFMSAKQGWQTQGGTPETGQLQYVNTDALNPKVKMMLKPLVLELSR